MDRETELKALRGRQQLANSYAADRAKRALGDYWPRKDLETLTAALTYFLADFIHLSRRENEVVDLGEVLSVAQRLSQLERVRTSQSFLENIEIPAEGA